MEKKMNNIHGHEVIQMIMQSATSSSKDDLIKQVISKFGEDTRFFNCSTDGMTAEGIVSFFENKGKIRFNDSGFEFGSAEGCKH